MIYCDETSFSVDGEQHWVWMSVTDKNIFYTIDESRGSQVLEDLLGDELAQDATLSCDGWSAYPSYHGKSFSGAGHICSEKRSTLLSVTKRLSRFRRYCMTSTRIRPHSMRGTRPPPPVSGGGRRPHSVWRN